MAPPGFVIKTFGPLVTIQDHGRYGFLRYGVPESGPMDRDAFEIAHAALGYDAGGAAIEVSLGVLVRTGLTRHYLPVYCSNDRADEFSTWTNTSRAAISIAK